MQAGGVGRWALNFPPTLPHTGPTPTADSTLRHALGDRNKNKRWCIVIVLFLVTSALLLFVV